MSNSDLPPPDDEAASDPEAGPPSREDEAVRDLEDACREYIREVESLWLTDLREEVLTTWVALAELEDWLRAVTKLLLVRLQKPLEVLTTAELPAVTARTLEWVRELLPFVEVLAEGLLNRTLDRFRFVRPDSDAVTQKVERFLIGYRAEPPDEKAALGARLAVSDDAVRLLVWLGAFADWIAVANDFPNRRTAPPVPLTATFWTE